MVFCRSASVRFYLITVCFLFLMNFGYAASNGLARSQPTVPKGWVETPFIETISAPKFTKAEQQRGYLLFQRPVTEPVYANTQPSAVERIDSLSAFATIGEFEPVTFSIYPNHELKNVQVQSSALEGKSGTIEKSQIDIRVVTYWNVAYPSYASQGTYRKVPELLEKVISHSSPAKECQRWWLTVRVPKDAQPGNYAGTVTIKDANNAQATKVPFTFRVLGYQLKANPKQHFSAYYYPRNRTMFKGRDENFIDKATANEYKSMVDHGLNMLPTFYIQYDSKEKKFFINHEEEITRAMAAGLKGPLPLLGGNGISRLYRMMTPGGKRASHWKINKMPAPEFYQQLTLLFRQLKQECTKKGFPEIVCCPLDEVAASHNQFGYQVYKAVKAAGIKTYATKFPTAPDARFYVPFVDIWCSQPFAKNYQQVKADQQHEYWSYPNHNAGERKNRTVMCKGGRMTYGFGLWKSGYTTLIPWHWAWTMSPDPFDYLRTPRSGSGQRIDEEGEVIPTIYWECFREGRDDGRYLFSLQQATWERARSTNAKCQHRVTEAKNMLQETWDAIDTQERYLADNVWSSTEFNARRWRIAKLTEQLLKYPITRSGIAPSVYVAIRPETKKRNPSIVEQAIANKNVTTFDLAEGFTRWQAETKEASIQIVPISKNNALNRLQWKVAIDHQAGGTADGKYNVGWPRVRRNYPKKQLDLSAYDFVEATLRVDSNRDEVADDITKLGLAFSSHSRSHLYEIQKDLGDQQRKWLTLRYNIPEMIKTADRGIAPWQSIKHVQFFVSEANYQQGDQLTFDIAKVRLMQFKAPVISRVIAPRFVLLPRKSLPIQFEVMGTSTVKPNSHVIRVTLIDDAGKEQTKKNVDLAINKMLVLKTSTLSAGKYKLRLMLTTSTGKQCSQTEQPIEFLNGY